jgi:hypothetical protein
VTITGMIYVNGKVIKMKTVFSALILMVIFKMHCLGQEIGSTSQTNGSVKRAITSKTLYADWLNYATNNASTKSMIQQKCEIDSQIDVLHKQRVQFSAQGHDNTSTNTPYMIIDESGHNRAYPSREAYYNETVGGLIKSSLKINNEINKQQELYFAAHGSNATASVDAKLTPPSNLRIIIN